MEPASPGFDNAAKQLLEELFGMSTGYVMEFVRLLRQVKRNVVPPS